MHNLSHSERPAEVLAKFSLTTSSPDLIQLSSTSKTPDNLLLIFVFTTLALASCRLSLYPRGLVATDNRKATTSHFDKLDLSCAARFCLPPHSPVASVFQSQIKDSIQTTATQHELARGSFDYNAVKSHEFNWVFYYCCSWE